MKTIVLPTEFPIRLEIPEDYPIPPVGSDFYINYENYCPAVYWGDVKLLLGRNVLTVEKLEDGEVFLHEGALPLADIEDTEEWKALFEAYWLLHPETNPFLEPLARKFIAFSGASIPFRFPVSKNEFESTTALRVVGVFDSFEEWQYFYVEHDGTHDIEKAGVTEWPLFSNRSELFDKPFHFQQLIDEFLASGSLEPYYLVMKSDLTILWVDRCDREPWQGKGMKSDDEDSYFDHDIEISYTADEKVEVWCLARSSKDACRLAVFHLWIDSAD